MSNEVVNCFLLIASFLIILLTVTITVMRNYDVFSPVKVYLLFNVVFYLDIFISEYETIILFIYFLQNLILLCISLVEPKRKNIVSITPKFEREYKLITVIWCFSLISVVNQLVMIQELGGVVAYVANIAFRVEYFKGKGYLAVLNTFMALCNVIYLAVILNKENRSWFDILLFCFNTCLFIAIALLSGSRSFLLMTFLVQIILINYYTNKINYKKLALLGLIIMFLAGIMGVVRNSINTADGTVTINTTEKSKLDSTHFRYGLMPLEIIFKAEVSNLYYGKTYLALFTNFIPRSIFPDKLDTGGLIFTKEYTGDRWGGLSNLATGAVTEGIINFGFMLGTLVGLVTIGMFYYVGIYIYRKLLYQSEVSAGRLILYIYLILAFARYSYSDFSYLFFSLIVNVVVPLVLIVQLSKLILYKSK